MYPKLRENPKASAPQKVEQPPQPTIKKWDPPKTSVPTVEPVSIGNVGEGEDHDIEMEETVHDYDKMVSIAVIEAEMELMQ